jgi:hypothetical protein
MPIRGYIFILDQIVAKKLPTSSMLNIDSSAALFMLTILCRPTPECRWAPGQKLESALHDTRLAASEADRQRPQHILVGLLNIQRVTVTALKNKTEREEYLPLVVADAEKTMPTSAISSVSLTKHGRNCL